VGFAAGGNVGLAFVNLVSSAQFHLEPPERLRVRGSWKVNLTVDDPAGRLPGLPSVMPINVRSFSYRPITVFLALALASTLSGRRRNLQVFGGGLGIMVVLTTGLTALPALTEMAVRNLLGAALGAIVRTAFMALLTPIVPYVLPLVVWGVLMLWTRPKEPGDEKPDYAAATTAPLSPPPP
jgi:hypothetical protein